MGGGRGRRGDGENMFFTLSLYRSFTSLSPKSVFVQLIARYLALAPDASMISLMERGSSNFFVASGRPSINDVPREYQRCEYGPHFTANFRALLLRQSLLSIVLYAESY